MEALHQAVNSAKGIVFDLYHTLTARESEWSAGPMTYQMLGVTREAWEDQLFKTSRFRLAGEERDPFRIVARMARAIDPRISDDTIARAVRNRQVRFAGALKAIPGGNVVLLAKLRARGTGLGLVSNADAMEIAAWKDSPLASFFDSTIFSCEVGWVKPEPEIFLCCLEALKLKPDQCLFVGDGGSDELRAARDLGFVTVMVAGVIRELWPDRIAARSKDADFVVEDPSGLLPN
jgi:putative hydrolase of the HAD superfamily